jgi:hypothetical protein
MGFVVVVRPQQSVRADTPDVGRPATGSAALLRIALATLPTGSQGAGTVREKKGGGGEVIVAEENRHARSDRCASPSLVCLLSAR